MLSFLRHHPVGLRVWHWFNAATITGLLTTVALRKTLFSVRRNAAIFVHEAEGNGVTLDPKLARDMAHRLVDRLWDWHVYLGYTLGALLLLRIFLIFWQRESPWGLVRAAHRQFRAAPSPERRPALHFTAVRSLYLAFYMAVTWMVVSGLLLVYSDNLNLSDSTVDTVHNIHEIFQWFFFAFVAIHIGGVLCAEFGKYRGIVSRMIHGGD